MKLPVDFDQPPAKAVASLSSWVDQKAAGAASRGSQEHPETPPDNSETPVDEKDAGLVKQLRACVKDGVDSRSAAGQQLTAYLKNCKNQKEAFDSIKGIGSAGRKAEFRKASAELEVAAKVKLRRSKLEQLHEITGGRRPLHGVR